MRGLLFLVGSRAANLLRSGNMRDVRRL